MTETRVYKVQLIYRSLLLDQTVHSTYKTLGNSCKQAFENAVSMIASYIDVRDVLYWSVQLDDEGAFNEALPQDQPGVPSITKRRKQHGNRRSLSTARLRESDPVGDIKGSQGR